MIDYIQMVIPITHKPLPVGSIVSVSPDGEVEYESVKSLDHKGSWETSIRFRSQGSLDENGCATELYIKGNPAKFLQGHNVFGTTDLITLVREVLKQVSQPLGLPLILDSVISKSVVSRIDITYSIQFETDLIAQAYIKQVGLRAHTRSGRPIAKGHTLAFQPKSNRFSFVIYHKGAELTAHKLPEQIPCRDLLINDASRLVRVELRLKTNELKQRNLRTIDDISKADLTAIYQDYVRRIAMSTEASIPTETIKDLKRCYRDTYLLWEKGIDIQSITSQNTFYRHRRHLLGYGIDISIPKNPSSTAEIIPLTRAIEGKPYQIPNYAFEHRLIAGLAA